MADQICSTPGCKNIVRYTTRTKPAYCDSCIQEILAEARVIELEPFQKPSEYFLTQCTECGITAHYRFEYILEKLKQCEPVCRACYCKNLYAKSWKRCGNGQGMPNPITQEEASKHSSDYGYKLLDIIQGAKPGEELFHLQCESCGRISVKRWGDIGWRCSCISAPKGAPSKKPSDRNSISRKTYLKDTENKCLKWWDFESNDPDLYQTATIKTRKEAFWICPECGNRFSAPIYRMTRGAVCPRCEDLRVDEFHRIREIYSHTTVADVPYLLEHWDDITDPKTVMVNTCYQYKWVCDNGHHPRQSPAYYLENGCPTCRGTHKGSRLIDDEPEIACQWHPTKNGNLKLEDIPTRSKRDVWWLCDRCGHEWIENVKERTIRPRIRCPKCGGRLGSLAWQEPELADEWSDKNPVSAWDIAPNGSLSFVPEWVCTVNSEHVWKASLSSRINGAGCPECADKLKSRVELEYFEAAKRIFDNAKSGYPCINSKFSRCWRPDILVERQDFQLIIEYDGEYWHSPNEKREVDVMKTLEFLAAGFLVVRLRENNLCPLNIQDDAYLEIRVLSEGYECDETMRKIKAWTDGLCKNGKIKH